MSLRAYLLPFVIAGCGASTTAATTSSPAAADAGDAGDAGAADSIACPASTPVRYVVSDPDNPLGPNVHDACEALPATCKDTDAATACDCIVGIKSEVDDAGQSACPGRGPIYCDRRADGTYLVRCAPP